MAIEVIDLVDVDLPMTLPLAPGPSVQSCVGRIDRADAFVVITPEYNHGYPASLKQAIDLAREEWCRNAVGFVSYGGVSGGLRAVEQLRQVFAELHTATMRDSVSFAMAHDHFDEAGQPRNPTACRGAATTMLDQLAWWATALRTARHDDAVLLEMVSS
jgi:NAD(P)H-dependent FMN reductase